MQNKSRALVADELLFPPDEPVPKNLFAKTGDTPMVEHLLLEQEPLNEVVVAQTILKLQSDFETVIYSSFGNLKREIANRRLFVLFERTLKCDPLTDHLTSKNVLPLFEQFIDGASRLIRAIMTSDISQLVKSCVAECLRSELEKKLNAQTQLSLSKQKLVEKTASLHANGELVVELMDQLDRMRQQQQKILQLMKEQGDIRKQIGAIYRPDFAEGGQYPVTEGDAEFKTGNPKFDSLLQKLRFQIQDLLKKIQQLEREIEQKNRHIATIPGLQHTIVELRARVAELELMMQQYLGDFQRQLASLQSQLDLLRKENDSLRLDLNSANEKLTEHGDVDDLRRQLEELLKKLAEVQAENDQLRKSNDLLKQQLEAANKEIDNLKEQLEIERIEKLRAMQQVDELNKQLIEVKAKGKKTGNVKPEAFEQLKTDLQNAKLELDRMRADMMTMAEKIARYEQGFQRAADVVEGLTGYQIDSNLPNYADFIKQNQIQLDTINKCVYLYQANPTSKDQFVGAGLDPNGAITKDQMDILRNQLKQDQFNVQFNQETIAGNLGKQNTNVNYANTNGSRENPSLINTEINNMITSTTHKNTVAGARDGKNRQTGLNGIGKQLSHEGEDQDCETIRRFGQTAQDMDSALKLLEEARRQGLNELEKHKDFGCQVGGAWGPHDCVSSTNVSRAKDRINELLKLNPFTWKTKLSEYGDLPEVFKRLYEMHAYLLAKRDALQEQYLLFCRDFNQRIAFQQSQLSLEPTGGLSIRTQLSNNTMFRVQNIRNSQLNKVIDMQGTGQRVNISGLPLLPGTGTRKISNRNEQYNNFLDSLTIAATYQNASSINQPSQKVQTSRVGSGKKASQITDAELLDAIFSEI